MVTVFRFVRMSTSPLMLSTGSRDHPPIHPPGQPLHCPTAPLTWQYGAMSLTSPLPPSFQDLAAATQRASRGDGVYLRSNTMQGACIVCVTGCVLLWLIVVGRGRSWWRRGRRRRRGSWEMVRVEEWCRWTWQASVLRCYMQCRRCLNDALWPPQSMERLPTSD